MIGVGPTRRGAPRRPTGPWAINLDSPQSEGLVCFLPLMDRRGDSLDRRGRRRFTHINSPTWVNSNLNGRVLNFVRASSQYIGLSPALLSTTPVTMACWFNSNSITVDQTLISISQSGASTFQILDAEGATAGDPIRAGHVGSGSGGSALTTTGYSANTWTHAAGVFAASNSRTAYINGGSSATDTGAIGAYAPNTTAIGRLSFVSAVNHMSGQITHVCIWNVALTPAMVAALYDPATRWDLYYPLGRIAYLLPAPEEEAASTFTATAALTVGAATASGSATHTTPVYTATAALTIGAATASGSATHTPPSYAATAAVAVSAATALGSATHVRPTYTGTAGLAVAPTTTSGTAAHTTPTYTGTSAVTTGATTAAGTATHTRPTYTGTSAVTAGAATLTGSAAFSTNLFTGTAAWTAPRATLAGSGTVVNLATIFLFLSGHAQRHTEIAAGAQRNVVGTGAAQRNAATTGVI